MSKARIFKNGKIASEDRPDLTPADVLVDEKGQISAVGVNIDAGNGGNPFPNQRITQ